MLLSDLAIGCYVMAFVSWKAGADQRVKGRERRGQLGMTARSIIHDDEPGPF